MFGLVFGLVQLTREAAGVVAGNSRWMAWNLVLALVPLVLAVRLFRPGVVRSRLWWVSVGAFVLFLPNAPYVLTDVVHLYGDVRAVESDAVLSLAVLPQYALFMVVGAVSYAASLIVLSSYVGPRFARWLRLGAHAASALGIYLGRVVRLNSWDALLRPASVVRAVSSTLSVGGVLLLAITFLVLVLLTDVVRWAWEVRRRLAALG
jgi:uncharacterized membrane protein